MKICYVSCSAIYGGVEKIIIDSLNALSKTHSCRLIVPKGCKYLSRLDEVVDVHEYQSIDKRYNPFLHFELAKMARGYDIVHTHGAKATLIISHIRPFCHFTHVATKHNNRKGKVFNRIKNVISVSKAVARTISHESETIYFGIDLQELNLPVMHSANKLFTLTAIGRLDAIKGFDSLIKQVAMLDFPFRLNIIGEGIEKENLQRLIQTNNLNEKVFLLGFQDNISTHLNNAHMQVISSRNEGLPITLLEGLMNSPIVLSTPVGGISEVLSAEFLANIEDFPKKITEIYAEYDHYYQIFQTHHQSKKQIFTFKNYFQHLTDYYEAHLP